MNASNFCIDLIKRFEGFREAAYKPVKEEKNWTIAYGHSGPDVKQGQVVTKEQGEKILRNDIQRFVDGVNKLLKVSVNQYQFDALVSFAYNCGLGNLEDSDLLKFVNKKDFKDAANEFPKWVHGANREVLPGLVKRRAAEKALFEKSVPTIHKEKPKPHNSIKSVGKIKIIGVKHSAHIVDRPSVTAENLSTIDAGKTIEISGSVPGWWEVIYNGSRAYVNERFGKLIN